MFQVSNTPAGYVVEAYRTIGPFWAWAKLANFGDNQGDARIFAFRDAPKLSEGEISYLIKNYDKEIIFRKLASGHYQMLNKNV